MTGDESPRHGEELPAVGGDIGRETAAARSFAEDDSAELESGRRGLLEPDEPVGVGADVILDFDDFGEDRIDVSALFGPTMTYRHNLAFTAAGQVRVNDIAGADLLVEVNTGGTLAADLAIRLTATTLASMAATDFVL